MTRRGWLLFLALGVIWGTPYLLIRVAVVTIDPLVVAFGRTVIGAMLLLPIAVYRGELLPALRHWPALVLFTLVEITGPWLLLGHAERHISSSMAGLLLATVPLIAAVIVTRLGHERMEPRRIGGLAIGFAGVVALVGLDIEFSELAAVGAVFLTAVGYAIGPIVINRRLAGVPGLGVVAASLALAACFYAPFAPMLWPVAPPVPAIAAVVALGVFCTAVAFVLFFALIVEVGSARATVITYVNTVVAIALGVLLLDEPLTTGMLVGFPLVVAGLLLGTARSSPAAHVPAAAPAGVSRPPGQDAATTDVPGWKT